MTMEGNFYKILMYLTGNGAHNVLNELHDLKIGPSGNMYLPVMNVTSLTLPV